MSFHNDYLRVLPAEPYPERELKTQLELLHNELQRALAKRPPYEQTERADLSIGVSAGFHDFFTKRQLSIPDNLVVTYRYLEPSNNRKMVTDIYFRDLEVELPVAVNDRAGYTVNLYRRVPKPKPARDLERPEAWRLVPKHVIDDVVARLEATESGDLLHDLESSVNASDVVPSDFRAPPKPDLTRLKGWVTLNLAADLPIYSPQAGDVWRNCVKTFSQMHKLSYSTVQAFIETRSRDPHVRCVDALLELKLAERQLRIFELEQQLSEKA